jgi:hypothetical protein
MASDALLGSADSMMGTCGCLDCSADPLVLKIPELERFSLRLLGRVLICLPKVHKGSKMLVPSANLEVVES